jgi:hypothetical protein
MNIVDLPMSSPSSMSLDMMDMKLLNNAKAALPPHSKRNLGRSAGFPRLSGTHRLPFAKRSPRPKHPQRTHSVGKKEIDHQHHPSTTGLGH